MTLPKRDILVSARSSQSSYESRVASGEPNATNVRFVCSTLASTAWTCSLRFIFCRLLLPLEHVRISRKFILYKNYGSPSYRTYGRYTSRKRNLPLSSLFRCISWFVCCVGREARNKANDELRDNVVKKRVGEEGGGVYEKTTGTKSLCLPRILWEDYGL